MRFRISLLGGSLIEKKYIWNDAVRRRSDRFFFISLVSVVNALLVEQYFLPLFVFSALGIAGFVICLREAYFKK